MLIRPATAADAHGIARVHVTAWQWAYAGLLPQAAINERTFEQRLEKWTRVLDAADGPERVVVADDGAIRGFAAYGPARDGTDGELYALYIDREVIGTGVGRALHDRALEGLRAAGHARATLWVLETNAYALAFYARCGWMSANGEKVVDFAGENRVEIQIAREL